jgi:hypothetical protein
MRACLATVFLVLGASTAAAQNPSATSVFAFGGAGSIRPDHAFTFWVGPTWRAGGGVEHRFATGVLVQGELEWLGRPRSPGDTMTLLPSVSLGFASARTGVRPFASGGFTFADRSAAFNFGGGVNVPFRRRTALRLEFRDHWLIFDEPLHSYGVRLGLTLR